VLELADGTLERLSVVYISGGNGVNLVNRKSITL
jgi:hypothetical protein